MIIVYHMCVPHKLTVQHMVLIVGGFNLNQVLLENFQGLIQAVFQIGIPIFGTLIWVCPNLILSKTETTIKSNFSFLIKSAT